MLQPAEVKTMALVLAFLLGSFPSLFGQVAHFSLIFLPEKHQCKQLPLPKAGVKLKCCTFLLDSLC